MKRHFLYSWLFIITASLLSACGGGSSSSSTNGSIRLVNATQVAGLTLTVTDNATISNIGVGAASGYTSLGAASYSVIVSAPNGSLATSTTASVTITADVQYTVVAYARGGQIKLLTLTDSQTAPTGGFASVTAINAGQDAGTLDVYMVSPGSSITNLTATFSSVAASSTSLTQLVTAGTYDIIVTGYSNPSDLRLTIPSVALTSGEIVSVVLTSTTGGALVDGALVQQGGSVQLQPAVKARVRVAAAFGDSSNTGVVTTVGGTSIGSITSPSVGAYALVPANSTAYTISVAGTAVGTLPSATFASGGDYTILVYGALPTTPSVVVLTDSNLLPSTGAKIRLINMSVSTAGLSLSDNYTPLFSEIPYGTTSAYVGVVAGTSLLQLTSPSASAFAAYNTSVSILSGSVYSLFVLDTHSATIPPSLKKDR
jgi:hypothetical protein